MRTAIAIKCKRKYRRAHILPRYLFKTQRQRHSLELLMSQTSKGSLGMPSGPSAVWGPIFPVQDVAELPLWEKEKPSENATTAAASTLSQRAPKSSTPASSPS